MHDGSIRSLEDIVEHYNSGGVERPSRSDLIVPLGLKAQEKLDLVAFLAFGIDALRQTRVLYIIETYFLSLERPFQHDDRPRWNP